MPEVQKKKKFLLCEGEVATFSYFRGHGRDSYESLTSYEILRGKNLPRLAEVMKFITRS
jgi:hypothetical protein